MSADVAEIDSAAAEVRVWDVGYGDSSRTHREEQQRQQRGVSQRGDVTGDRATTATTSTTLSTVNTVYTAAAYQSYRIS